MTSATEPTTARPDSTARQPKRRGGRRPKLDTSERVRFFVAKPSSKSGSLTLEQELASEPEALVAAFKSDSRIFTVREFTVTQRIEGNNVSLIKEPVASGPRVSTTNAS